MTITCNTSEGLIEVRNPQWTPTDTIDCEILHKDYGWIPYTASSSDDRPMGRELFEFLSAGQVQACPDSRRYDEAAYDVRERRNLELTQSDWLMNIDSPVANVNEWTVYRQALRDITEQVGYPHDVAWPTKPEYIKS